MSGRIRWATGLAVATTAAFVVAVPLARLFLTAAEDTRGLVAALSTDRAVNAGLNTIAVAIGSVVVSLVVGTTAALVVHRSGRRGLGLAMLSPLLVPPFVSALSWVDAYSDGGLMDDWTGVTLGGLFGASGIVAVISVNAAPVVFLVVSAALRTRNDHDLTEAARAAGATPRAALGTVTLPLIRNSLVGSAALVFILAANAFGVPAVLGIPAGYNTVTTLIYRDLAFSADPTAFLRAIGTSSLLVVASVVFAVVVERSGSRPAYAVQTSGPARSSAALRGWSLALWIYWAVGLALPMLALVLRAIVGAPGMSAHPRNWTLRHFDAAFSPSAIRAITNTVVLALAAATICVIIGLALASMRRNRAGALLAAVPVSTFAVPGSALAVAVTIAYGAALRDTLLLVLIAYLAKFWVLAHRPVSGAIDRIPAELSLAARAAGASAATATRTVQMPLLWPAIQSGWLLVVLFAFHELTMSVLLFGPGSETLATVILNMRQLGDVSTTAAMATSMTLGVSIIGVLLVRAVRSWMSPGLFRS